MASIPRVITVDPTWIISRIVRSAIDLTDRAVIQVDVPGAEEALGELTRGAHLLVTALSIGNGSNGADLARRVRQASPHTPIVVLADMADSDDQDEALKAESSFFYLRRPVDVQIFMRVLMAGLDGRNIVSAFDPVPVQSALPPEDMGPVPALDLKAAQVIIDKLLTDVGAMAIVLSNRNGQVMLERGAVGYLDREALTRALLPTVKTTISMGSLVGGQPSALQFFDGDTYDVFVLSIGFHHFLSLVFDGTAGVRQFGAVTRFGRRSAEDLRALLGASAYMLKQPSAVEQPLRKPVTGPLTLPEEFAEPLAVKADVWAEEPSPAPEETETLQLEPIENLDLSIFDDLPGVDAEEADDLFSPDKLAKIANESHHGRGPISYEEARNLGIVP